jgi:hypothetical protein
MRGVTEFAAGFNFNVTERGIVATRVFHYDPSSIIDAGVVIPIPGDTFGFEDMVWPDLRFYVDLSPESLALIYCRTRNITTLAGHPEKFVITCEYNNEPIDPLVFLNPTQIDTYKPTPVEKLPMTLEYSGENVTLEPVLGTTTTATTQNWKWTNSGLSVLQPLPFKVNSSTLRIVRYVYDGKFDVFQRNVRRINGRVNSSDNPFGTKVGGLACSWLFNGCTTEVFYNWCGLKFWKAEMEFQYRNPECAADDTNGWQKLLDLNGTWDMPYVAPPSPYRNMYGRSTFFQLFDDTELP